MNRRRKLKAVVRHEFLTIIRQPSFWISLVAFPLLAGLIVLIGALTDSSDKTDLNQTNEVNIVVVDSSRLINEQTLSEMNLSLADEADKASLEQSVKNGQIDGLIYYPSDLATTGRYQMYADDTDKDNSKLVNEIGRIALQQSILSSIPSNEVKELVLSGGEGSLQIYTKGEPQRTFPEYIVPGAFLVLFYIVLIFSVGYALTSVSEEKENRSIEMVLSYVKPQTLIVGKLFAIILVTLTQIVFIALMAAFAYLVARLMGNNLSLPLNISDLTFVPAEIFIGISFLVFGFIFFVGLMAMIGSIFPSSKEASGFSTVFYLLPAIPFWGINAITNEPDAMFTQILTYFPLSSPTTVLIRNASGNLSLTEGIISLAILVVSTIVIIGLAAKAFRMGTLEYSDRIKISSLLKKQ